jgi:signal transduction histidine kinase
MRKRAVERSFSVAVALFALVFHISALWAQEAELDSDKAEQVRNMVDKAAALIKQKGRSAFDEFAQRDSEWFHDDIYLFIDSSDGTVWFHPVTPQLIGTNVWDRPDATGQFYFQHEARKVMLTQGSGWISYMYPKPGESTPSRKWGYIRKIEYMGQLGWVGSGVYLK